MNINSILCMKSDGDGWMDSCVYELLLQFELKLIHVWISRAEFPHNLKLECCVIVLMQR